MTKEEDQAFREANSGGEERCGNCFWWQKGITTRPWLAKEMQCKNPKAIEYKKATSDLWWCGYQSESHFTPNRGSSLGETKHTKEEE